MSVRGFRCSRPGGRWAVGRSLEMPSGVRRCQCEGGRLVVDFPLEVEVRVLKRTLVPYEEVW